MRRVVLVLAAMALVLLLASGVAMAVNKIGTNGPDTLRGTNRADNISGRGGNDAIFSLAGKDHVLGGPGKDFLFGGKERRGLLLQSGGAKDMAGGRGNDAVFGGNGADDLSGDDGNDWLGDGTFTESAEDNLSGGDGNDLLDAINRPAFYVLPGAIGAPWIEAISYLPFVVGVVSVPISMGIAILRYRLYDIDIFINRTLVYGSLTATLVALYFGGIVVLQRLFVALTARSPPSQWWHLR